jgi:type II secretion system protein J
MMRRGFTLIELMVAGTMAAILLGGITTSLSQLGSAKSISRHRLEAFSRCDAALRTIRKDIITVLRRDDLFDTRILISDFTGSFQGRLVDQDELLVFNGNLRANKEIDFNGEGFEYETQFRLEENDVSTALWKRRDAILDDNPIGGGMAIPIAEGIISLQIEAFDGTSWYGQWDSDELGIPTAVRVTVIATGMQSIDDLNSPLITLRTVVPLDRFMPPADLYDLVVDEDEDGSGSGVDGITGDGEDSGTGSGGTGSGGSDSGGSGSGGSGTGGKDDGGKGDAPGTISTNNGITTITDPDGNVHQIPNP